MGGRVTIPFFEFPGKVVPLFEPYGPGNGKDSLMGVLDKDMGLSEPFMFLILKGRHAEKFLESFFELVLVGIAKMGQLSYGGQWYIQIVHDMPFGFP